MKSYNVGDKALWKDGKGFEKLSGGAIFMKDDNPADVINFDTEADREAYIDNNNLHPVWRDGMVLAVGDTVWHEGTLYVVIQAHTSQTDWTPDIVPALFNVIPDGDDWQVGVSYAIGDEVLYDGVWYRCIQAHTSQEDWTPPNTPALWELKEAGNGDDEIPEWQTGVAYSIGDKVTYNGVTYECRQAHTSQAGWEPPNVPALWLVVEE